MLRSIEIEYEGQLDQGLLDEIVSDLGVLVERTKPLVVLTATPRRDVPALVRAAGQIPGLRKIWIREACETIAFQAS
jgi:hypothetical protein